MTSNGRGNRKSLSTPQLRKQNDSKSSRRSVSSLNLDTSETNLNNDSLFDNIMNNPVKRTILMNFLAQERENIEKYKQNEDKKKVNKFKRNERLLHCESPTALLRRRALETNRRDSDSSSTTSDSKSITPTPVSFENLLKGVVGYVEIRSKEGDRSAGAKAIMQSMGATVKDHFSTEVTHVVFKDGSFTTYQKAKLKKVYLVSILWLEAVRKFKFRVPEKNYPALGTEAFDVNMSQICSDYEKLVNEEKRRSQAMGLASPFNGIIRGRKTALPSELKPIQENLDIPSPTTGSRLSEVIIPTSQDWEAESVISYTSGTLPFRRIISTVPEDDSDRFPISTPELTSDDDSDCGVINGHSFKRDSSSLDLGIVEKVQNAPEVENANVLCIPGPSGINNISNNTSSSRSASLLSRKSESKRKSSYQVVDMDLTKNLGKENINLKSRRSGSAKKYKRDSSLLSDNSTNLLDEVSGIKLGRRCTGNKSDRYSLPPNDKLFKQPYVDLSYIAKKCHSTDDIFIVNSSVKSSNLTRVTRSTSDLIGKKKYSVSSDETPSLRFSTDSKDTTDKTRSIRTSETGEICNGQKNHNKNFSNSEEMPSLRICSNDASGDKRCSARISGEVVQKSPNDEEMSLRISTSISSNDTSGKKRCSARISGEVVQKSPQDKEMPSLRISSSSSSNDISGKRRKKNHESKSLERYSTQTSVEVVNSSLISEDMPSLRISSSSNDNSDRMKTRSSKSPSHCNTRSTDPKIEAKNAQNNSSNNDGSEKKKRGSKSSPQIELEGHKDQNSEDELGVKKKRKSGSSKCLRQDQEDDNREDASVMKKKRKLEFSKSPPRTELEGQEDQSSKDGSVGKKKNKSGSSKCLRQDHEDDNREDASVMKKKRKLEFSKSPPRTELEGQEDQSGKDGSAVKKKNKSESSKSLHQGQEGYKLPQAELEEQDALTMKKKSSECDSRTSDQDGSLNIEDKDASSLEIFNDTRRKKKKASGSKEILQNQNKQDGIENKTMKSNLRSSKSLSTRASGSLISEDISPSRISAGDSIAILEKPKKDDSKLLKEDSNEKTKKAGSSRRIHNITPISENQTSSCNEDEPNSNGEETRGSTHDSDKQRSTNNEDNLTDSASKVSNLSTRTRRSRNASNQSDLKSTSTTSTRSSSSFKSKEFSQLDESVVTDIIASLDSPKKFENTSSTPNKKQKLANNEKSKEKGENKKFRKLYNLNQSVEETLKNFDWAKKDENKDDASTTTTTNSVVPKKPFTVPLAPIAVTPIAKQLLEIRKKKSAKAKKDKISKKQKEPPKPQKKVCLDSSKDEQKELTDEYVKKQKINTNEESRSDNKRSAPIARRSQRVSQCQKRDYKDKSSNSGSDSEEPIRPEVNRRSTFDFVKTSPTKTQRKATQKNRRKIPSIACTRMHRPEVQTFMQVVKKLGSFIVEDEVSKKTTHLVVGEPKRTINLLRALARGCWILKQEWLFRSLEAEKWLPEEDFEVTDFSPSVQKCRIERQAFGSLYSMDIFENCGPIYIARSSIPRRSDLQELVQLCKGTVTNVAYNSRVVVGEWVRYENVACVTEMWILDSITCNRRRSFKNYFIKR